MGKRLNKDELKGHIRDAEQDLVEDVAKVLDEIEGKPKDTPKADEEPVGKDSVVK
jgi:hypothetical protein